VAATLTGAGELTYYSFEIDATKTEETPDGNLVVFGKATDGSVDSDEQIVDPGFASKAIDEWLATGPNVRVQHQSQRDPAGVGLNAEHGADGTWVKALVVEPVAQRLVKAGALRAYSVGIARPTIQRDRVARGGRITDGQIVEISLVDRPANKNCGIQLVKAADDGTPEYVGKMFGDEDVLTKAGGGVPADEQGQSITPPDEDSETIPSDTAPSAASMTPISMPGASKEDTVDVTVKVSPLDVAKMISRRVEKDHREFSAEQRREHAKAGNALPDGSYPIPDKDALRRAAILARSGHGNVSAARALIARRAKELGVANPLDEDDQVKKTQEMAEPDVEKETTDGVQRSSTDHDDDADDSDADDCGAGKAAKSKPKPKKGKGGKKMPPWLQNDDDDDGKNAGDSKTSKAMASSDDDDEPAADEEQLNAEKSSPTPADGVTGHHADPVPPHLEPDGPYQELFERDAHMEDGDHESTTVPAPYQAARRLKSIGIPAEMGMLHDFTCAAYAPDDVAKHYPTGGFDSIDEKFFAEKALNSAAMDTLADAAQATMLWTHARTLKMVPATDMVALQTEAHKAFQDANPGPGSAPTPGTISATRYRRPLITAGHEAPSPGSSAPQPAAHIPDGQIMASQFTRGPITSGHEAPSPANKGVGMPTTVDYVPTIKDNARQAMRAMHDHIAQTFPDVCPMHPGDDEGMHSNPVPTPGHGTPSASAVKTEELEAAAKSEDADVIKGMNKKMRKKLGKKVLAGKMTVDEARSKIGRMNAQKCKAEEEQPEVTKTVAEEALPVEAPAAEKTTDEPVVTKVAEPALVEKAMTPDLFKSELATALAPLLERIAEQDELLKKNQALLSSMVDMPDPDVAPFKGLAQTPYNRTNARPADVHKSVAEVAERTQVMMLRELETQFRTSPDPAQREAAWQSMLKMRGLTQ